MANFDTIARRLDRVGRWLSLIRFATVLAALALVVDGLSHGSRSSLALGLLLLGLFALLVVVHAFVAAKHDAALTRRDVHPRHLRRTTGAWTQFSLSTTGTLESDHDYAHDLDLLSAPANLDTIRERQTAVEELSRLAELRQELEASTDHRPDARKVSGGRFTDFSARTDLVNPAALFLSWFLPCLSAGGLAWVMYDSGPTWLGLLPLAAQVLLILRFWAPITRKLELLEARRRDIEGLENLLRVIESAQVKSPLLQRLRSALDTAGQPPSRQLRRLRFWVGLADAHMQPLIHPFLNGFLLWDIHVIAGIERWNRRTGKYVMRWLDVIGEMEALSSLATLCVTDPGTTFPELIADGDVEARALAHPLLKHASRQPNDLSIGPNGIVVLTGSNMAGKSTLLRAVGLNLALAFAGGPVCAGSLRTPVLRVRASTRARDSLEMGASYFRAELAKLERVIASLDESPPVFYLLDELLRGTNASARARSARDRLFCTSRSGKRGASWLRTTTRSATSKAPRTFAPSIFTLRM